MDASVQAESLHELHGRANELQSDSQRNVTLFLGGKRLKFFEKMVLMYMF